VALSIKDDGLGMDGDTVTRIFDPYYTTKETGTGLGLSTVHGIVKQHGGDVRVKSELGVGTEFEVLLPATDRAPLPTRDRQTEVAPVPSTTREATTVLVVEDEEAVRRVIAAALTRSGYTVLDAEDGRGALTVAETLLDGIDLLVTDLMLPDTTGADLADAIRARRPSLPVLLMSGYAPTEVLHDRVYGRGLSFLEKPFMMDQLLSAVSQALEGSVGWDGAMTG
jgi:CheY-like chemotaxis protein